MTALHGASATDPGRVRATNQDMALVAEGLVAVADGMGGHAGGEVAASTAVEALRDSFVANPTMAGLVGAAERANKAVFDKGERESGLRGMGTTLTAAAIVPAKGGDKIGVVNIGDSRAYLLEGERLTQLTSDHSLVEEMVRQGEITPDEALVHPHRHILTRALGIDPAVDVDSWTIAPHAGMRILLCSDGLTNECTNEEIAQVLTEFVDANEAAAELVERAVRHGGSDNVTVVVADVEVELGNEATSDSIEDIRSAHAVIEAEKPLRSSSKEVVPPPLAMPSAAGGEITTQQQKRIRSPRIPRRAKPTTAVAYVPYGPLFTPRVALFFLALILIIGGAFGFIVWFNNATYFVGTDGSNVAIYNGRPNGLLWMHPTLMEKTALSTSQVYPSSLTMLRSGLLESSFVGAKQVVTNLSNPTSGLGFPTTTTSTSTTTTTVISTTTTSVHVTTTIAKATH